MTMMAHRLTRFVGSWLVLVAAFIPQSPGIGAAEPAFYRAININGPAFTLDGNAWEGSKGAPNFASPDTPVENQSIPLFPPTDEARARMIRSFTYQGGGNNRVTLSQVPAGSYSVFLYAWEDNNPTVFDVFLNGQEVESRVNSGNGGEWQRLGPWVTEVKDGKIELTTKGGHCNMSGLEVWRGTVAKGSPHPTAPLAREQLDFFEGKIRPLLVENCYACHSAGADKVKGGLVLDVRAGWLRGGHSGPAIIPGNPDASLLIRAVRHADKNLKMPFEMPKLRTDQIQALEEWVRMGAPDPRDGAIQMPAGGLSKAELEKARQFWSFQPLTTPPVPKVKNKSWPRTDLDRFIIAKLEEQKLKPVEDADRRSLIRRATYDLTGLPPTPEEIAAFLADKSADAFARVVDRLLASRHYGERWGRHWMDLVRYADTAGDNSDYPIPQAYLYRNYIIDAFNQDKPYDQFIREQIAGDLLPAKNQPQRNEQVIATGYIAMSRRFGSVVDRYPQHLTIEDTIDNLSRTFLGLSLSCARCHDHKFDPVSQQDYYGLYGIFESTKYAFPGIELLKVQKDFVPLVSAAESDSQLKPFRDKERDLQKRHDELAARRKSLEDEKAALDKRIEKSTGEERTRLTAENQQLYQQIEEVRKQVKTASVALENHKKQQPEIPTAYAVSEGRSADARIQIKGEPGKTGETVPRKFLDILGGHRLPEAATQQSGRRQLADWIASPENPLTARVIVNRVWHYHFGDGLVRTPSDFGLRGLPPSHPELLDWLAQAFIADGWSFKQLHRRIMLSRVYQLSSADQEANLAVDPINQWHWRFNRQRLDAESLRDTLLALSGALDKSPLGEPHPFPPRDKWEFTQHHPFKDTYPSNHRSVYLMQKRLTAMPYFQAFDGADPNVNTPNRDASVTAVQALYLLNNEFVHEQAARFAERIQTARSTDRERVEFAFETTLGRPPTTSEREQALQYVTSMQAQLSAAGRPPEDLARQPWTSFARVLFRLNEFAYLD